MRIRLILAFCLCTAVLNSSTVTAHTVIKDKEGSKSVVLHFTPNDNPTAKSTIGIFYDIKVKQDLTNLAAELIVTSDNGTVKESIPMRQEGQTLYSYFVFPAKGNYDLQLKVEGEQDLIFQSKLLVGAGLGEATLKPSIPHWVALGFLSCVWAITLLIVLVVKRRKAILENSK